MSIYFLWIIPILTQNNHNKPIIVESWKIDPGNEILRIEYSRHADLGYIAGKCASVPRKARNWLANIGA